MTYEDLKKANETIKTTDIKGKEYAEVNQRIKAFRMLYPEGIIETQIISLQDGIVVMKATVSTESGQLLATGTAYEKESSSFINKTSYIENCETSAVGRALGMLGIGIDTSVASAEEVENAIIQQEKDKVIDETKAQALVMAIENSKIDEKRVLGILSKYGYPSIIDIKVKDYKAIVDELKALKEA